MAEFKGQVSSSTPGLTWGLIALVRANPQPILAWPVPRDPGLVLESPDVVELAYWLQAKLTSLALAKGPIKKRR